MCRWQFNYMLRYVLYLSNGNRQKREKFVGIGLLSLFWLHRQRQVARGPRTESNRWLLCVVIWQKVCSTIREWQLLYLRLWTHVLCWCHHHVPLSLFLSMLVVSDHFNYVHCAPKIRTIFSLCSVRCSSTFSAYFCFFHVVFLRFRQLFAHTGFTNTWLPICSSLCAKPEKDEKFREREKHNSTSDRH